MTPLDISVYTGHYFSHLRQEAQHNRAIKPYLNRLLTRIIVTNKTDAHLAPDAPKDVAVYYYLAGTSDEHLGFWRVSVIEAWMAAINDNYDEWPLSGPRRGLLRTQFPIRLNLNYSSLAERDHLFEQGYNTVHPQAGMGPVLWGDILWRNGEPVRPLFGSLRSDENYKHLATPLALLE